MTRLRRNDGSAPRALRLPGSAELFDGVLRHLPAGEQRWAHANPSAVVAAVERILSAAGGGCASPLTVGTSPLWDSEGRKYRVVYRILPASRDGSGPVVVSNDPRTLAVVREYPPAFQARDLQEAAEADKIAHIARTLDPERLGWCSGDSTIGAPVVWRGTGEGGTDPELYYVLGGNGRTISLLRADGERYGAYLDFLNQHWASLLPPGDPPGGGGGMFGGGPGARWVLVREVFSDCAGPRCAAVPLVDAIRLAASSQQSTAGEESAIGAALGRLRSLGLTDLGALPAFTWAGAINTANVDTFKRDNNAFWHDLWMRIAPERRTAMEAPDKSSELLNDIWAAHIPPELRRRGVGGVKEEEALMAAMPGILTVEQGIHTTREGADKIPPDWSLLDYLTDAVDFARLLKQRRTSIQRVPVVLEEAARQLNHAGLGRTLLGEIRAPGILLGYLIMRAARQKDPAELIGRVLTRYVEAAHQKALALKTPALFGGRSMNDPGDMVEVLSQVVDLPLPPELLTR